MPDIDVDKAVRDMTNVMERLSNDKEDVVERVTPLFERSDAVDSFLLNYKKKKEKKAKIEKHERETEYPNLNVCDINIDEKKANFEEFVELIRNQFLSGGEKYKLNAKREFTDGICEVFPGVTGVDWILGTQLKYLGRYKNEGREKDILQIANYCYILWLKGGFHKKVGEHDEDIEK